jgi:hypothetical protein
MTNRIQVAALIAGLIMLDAGFAWIYHPLGLIVGGGILVAMAIKATGRKQ